MHQRLAERTESIFARNFYIGQLYLWQSRIEELPEQNFWNFIFEENLPKAKNILIGGCGPGFRAFNLACLLPESQIVALDNYAPAIEYAKRKLTRDNLTFIQADLLDLPNLGPVDFVIFNYVTHHFEEQELTQMLQTIQEFGASSIYINDYDSSQNNTSTNPKLAAWRERRLGMGNSYPSLFLGIALILNGYGQIHQHEALRLDSQLAAHHYESYREILKELGFSGHHYGLHRSPSTEKYMDSFEIIATTS